MRLVLTILFAFGLAITAQAETLTGSDSKSYSSSVQLHSATYNGDRYATVTGRILMNGSLGGPLVLLSDIDGLPTWIDNLEAVKQIEQRSLTDRKVHLRFSAPVGLDDRDGLMRFVARSEGPNVVIMDIAGVDGFPEQAGAVRMRDVRGYFRFEQLQEGILGVEFRLHYDSSATPVFLANLSVKQQVGQTLAHLRRLIEGPLRNVSVTGPLARQLGI